jgi:hypothetical protein
MSRLDFAADQRLMALFPFPHELVAEATLSAKSLRIATTVRATGAVAVPPSAITRISGSRSSPAPTGTCTCRRGATSSWTSSRYGRWR